MKKYERLLTVGLLLGAGAVAAQTPSNGYYSDPNAPPPPAGAPVAADPNAPPPPPGDAPPASGSSYSNQYSSGRAAPANVPTAYAPAPMPSDKWADMRGVTLMVGGGVEGYTGALAPRIKAGPQWDAIIQFKPTSVLGIELGYTGAYNRFNPAHLQGATAGGSVIRNGGHAALTVGLSATRIQPYLLVGIGIDHYSVNGGGSGYSSTTNGEVPLGAGIRTYFAGGFTLDLRGTYDLQFGSSFAQNVNTSTVPGTGTSVDLNASRWTGVLMAGYTF